MQDTVTISNGNDFLSASAVGAEWTSWSVDGQQLLWQGDGRYWSRSAPVLFPVIGRCRDGSISVDGVSYPIGVHGFASVSRFDIADVSDDAVTFRLGDTLNSHQHFPFRFELLVTYTILDRSIAVDFVIANTGDVAMPYAIGFHPGFCWPQRGIDHCANVVFESEERKHVPVITGNGLFSDSERAVEMHGRTLDLCDANLASDALCFLNARSRKITFCQTGRPAILIENQDFPHIAVWTVPGAPFLSIESWTGHGDPETFDGELVDKPSMRFLEPGMRGRHGVSITALVTNHD